LHHTVIMYIALFYTALSAIYVDAKYAQINTANILNVIYLGVVHF